MTPLRRRRFLECDDLEAKRAEEENVIKEYGQQPLDECPDIAPETAERHDVPALQYRSSCYCRKTIGSGRRKAYRQVMACDDRVRTLRCLTS
jgi:hypothetical protein